MRAAVALVRRCGGPERGAAVVEFVVVFVGLVVPLVYAMVVMADVQRALLATSSGAREAGRVFVSAPSGDEALRRAGLAWRRTLLNYGFGAADGRARLEVRSWCGSGPSPETPSGCVDGFGPGAEVEVVAWYRVPVARLPFLGSVGGPGVAVRATHRTRVDRWRGLG